MWNLGSVAILSFLASTLTWELTPLLYGYGYGGILGLLAVCSFALGTGFLLCIAYCLVCRNMRKLGGFNFLAAMTGSIGSCIFISLLNKSLVFYPVSVITLAGMDLAAISAVLIRGEFKNG